MKTILSLILFYPIILFGLYEIQPLPFEGHFEEIKSSQNGNHYIVKRNSSHYLCSLGSKPIRMEPSKNISIVDSRINKEGLVIGVYTEDSRLYFEKLFIYQNKKFTELKIPFPKDWGIETARIVGFKESGEVILDLFLDMIHDDKQKDPQAYLFDSETIYFSYNVYTHKKLFYIPAKGSVYTLDKNNKMIKVKNDPRTPLLNDAHHNSLFINDHDTIAGCDEESQLFLWNTTTHTLPFSGTIVTLNNTNALLFNICNGEKCLPYVVSFDHIHALDVQEGSAVAQSMNDHNEVVGLFVKSAVSIYWEDQRAFVWNQEQGLQDLNELLVKPAENLKFREAHHIDNAGRIVVEGVNEEWQGKFYLLVPEDI